MKWPFSGNGSALNRGERSFPIPPPKRRRTARSGTGGSVVTPEGDRLTPAYWSGRRKSARQRPTPAAMRRPGSGWTALWYAPMPWLRCPTTFLRPSFQTPVPGTPAATFAPTASTRNPRRASTTTSGNGTGDARRRSPVPTAVSPIPTTGIRKTASLTCLVWASATRFTSSRPNSGATTGVWETARGVLSTSPSTFPLPGTSVPSKSSGP